MPGSKPRHLLRCTKIVEISKTITPYSISPARKFRHWTWYRLFIVYRAIFGVIFGLNIIALGLVLALERPWKAKDFTFNWLPLFIVTNFFCGTLIRNEHFINLLFKAVLQTPRSTPLWIRKRVAHVHHYGGFHSGCHTAAAIWFLLFLICSWKQPGLRNDLIKAVLAVTTTAFFLQVVIIIFAYPVLRRSCHDAFEISHRQGGWAILILLWILFSLLVCEKRRTTTTSTHSLVLTNAVFWLQLGTTALVIYPWTHHASRIHFTSKHRYSGGAAIKIGKSVLNEYHAFAIIPVSDNKTGFSILVSNAGNWTRSLIQNPPEKLWLRELPVYGVITVARLFSSVLLVTTGAGIGPCLGLLIEHPDLDVKVLWYARDPVSTYGSEIVDMVKKADEEASIIDTSVHGRLDIVQMAVKRFHESKAEAVVVISNKKVIDEVVFEMSKLGIPCYGPIFDS
ncbi:hypothetical protein BT63DRAFT_431902 [Microthyrium microscopicum]|uniref:Integral membrane protein TmpA n=1 Tax=Microthyrium microscopicum TaxID=703497 RepID=A0A6A6UI34_9PEZI|nr:hypothetical protein BT63DRAFT_431902 [Microthyrium microscopicum]